MSAAMTVVERRLHILQHALGLDKYGRGKSYRNRYVGGAEDCRPLVADGLMIERAPHVLTGGDPSFYVTEAGREYVAANSTKPPKVTRGQQRYRAFLDADSGVSFGEWLKAAREVAR